MTVELAAWIQAARSALRRALQSCRACIRRASGEDRRDRLRRMWQKFVSLQLRLNFKRREFACLGTHLRHVKERGKTA